MLASMWVGKSLIKAQFSHLWSVAILILLSACSIQGGITSAKLGLSASSPTNATPLVPFAVTAPAANAVVNMNNQKAVIFSGNCPVNSQSIIISIGVVSASATCLNNQWTQTVDLSTLTDGTQTGTVALGQLPAAARIQKAAPTPTPSAATSFQIAIAKHTVPPTVSQSFFTSPTTTNSSTMIFGGSCVPGNTIAVSGADTSTMACPANGSWIYQSAPQNVDSTYHYVFTAVDQYGNSSNLLASWVRKAAAPSLSVTSPAPATSVPAVGAMTMTGVCDPTVSIVTLSGAGLLSPNTTTCSGAGTFSQQITFTAGDGQKTVTASQTDGSGNTASVSHSYQLATTAQVTSIASPVDGSSVKATATLTGLCTGTGNVNITGDFTGSPLTATCSSNAFSQALTFSSPDGAKQITAAQTISGTTTIQTVRVTRITVNPNVAFSAPAPATIVSLVSVNALNVSGSCTVTGALVNFSVTGGYSDSTTCVAGNFSKALNLSTLAEGPFTLVAAQTDGAGNTGSVNLGLTKYTVPVAFAVTAPAANSVVNLAGVAALTLSGTCAGTGNAGTYNITGAATASGACTAGAWSKTLNISGLSDGVLTFNFSFTDQNSHTATASLSVTKDTGLPALALTSPTSATAPSAANFTSTGTTSGGGTAVTFIGTCVTGLQIQVIDHGIANGSVACTLGTWNYTSMVQTVDAAYAFSFIETSVNGNPITLTANWTRNTAAPTLILANLYTDMNNPPVIPVANLAANPITVMKYVTTTFSCSVGATLSFPSVSGATTAIPGVGSTICPAGGTVNTTYTLGGVDGPLTLTVNETGTNSITNSKNINLTKVTSGVPTFAFTNHGPQIVNATHVTSFAVSGTCNTNGDAITFFVTDTSGNLIPGSVGTPGAVTCNGTTWSGPTVDISAFVDGNYYLVGVDTSVGGASSSDRTLFQKLTVLPTMTLRNTNLTNTKTFYYNGGTTQYFTPPSPSTMTFKNWGAGGSTTVGAASSATSGAASIVNINAAVGGPQFAINVGAAGAVGGGDGGATSVSYSGLNVVTSNGGIAAGTSNPANVIGANGLTIDTVQNAPGSLAAVPLSADSNYSAANSGQSPSLGVGGSNSVNPNGGNGAVVVGWATINSSTAKAYPVSGTCSIVATVSITDGTHTWTTPCSGSPATFSTAVDLSSSAAGSVVSLTASVTDPSSGNVGTSMALQVYHLTEVIFNTAGSHSFSIPGGVTMIYARVWGAAGGAGSASLGGGGGFVSGYIDVTPISTLMVYVANGGTGNAWESSCGGWGNSGYGHGGEYSGVFNNTITYANTLLLAGGGGGGGPGCNSGWGGPATNGAQTCTPANLNVAPPTTSSAQYGMGYCAGAATGYNSPGNGGTNYVANSILGAVNSAGISVGGYAGSFNAYSTDPALTGVAGNVNGETTGNGAKPGYVVLAY